MKTHALLRILSSTTIFFLFVTFTSGQNERPGIECGCTKTGKYVAPAVKNITVEQGSASKKYV